MALAMPKSMTLGTGTPSWSVRGCCRFDVAVDDAFLVGVLDGATDLNEEFQSFTGGKKILITILGDARATDEFHDEVGPTGVRSTGAEDFGHVRMLHEGKGLGFGLETGDDLGGIHAELNELESDTATERTSLSAR